jgi:hypothetical protein
MTAEYLRLVFDVKRQLHPQGALAMKKNQLGFLNTVYIAMLVFGLGIFALEPTWTGLGAVLLILPGIAVNRILDNPAKRKAVKA